MALIVALILSVFMALVVYYDARYYKIPNWLNATFLLFYLVWFLLSPEPLSFISAISMFGVALGVGFILFALKLVGAGDVKLLAVCGLYTGWSKAGAALVIYMGVFGGILSLILVAIRFMIPMIGHRLGWKNIPKLFTMGAPAPYGLAIAAGFLILLWGSQLPGLVIS